MNRKERCESQGKGLRLQGEVCYHMGRFEITRGRSVTTKGTFLVAGERFVITRERFVITTESV